MAGLDVFEIRAVQESWSAVIRDKRQHGNEFLMRLFRTHPVTQNFFQKLKGKPLDQLRWDPALSSHSEKIMDGLNTVVESVDDGFKLGEYIQWMSKFHYNMDVKLDYFTYAFSVLVTHFQEVFSNTLSKMAWEKVFNNVYSRLEDEYKSLSRLTSAEIAIVRESWDIIMERKLIHGNEFLIRLFKRHPETQDIFAQFTGIPLDQLRSTTELSVQSEKILDGLDNVIYSLDDKSKVWGIIHWFGKFHFNRGIRLDYFKSGFSILVSYFQEIFGSRFRSDVWEKTFAVIYNSIADEYEKLDGLNAGELGIVRENWALIQENKAMHGNAFLYRLFQKFPPTQEFFDKFRGMSVEELKSLPALTVHSGLIMDGLTNIMAALDDDSIFQSHINWMVEFHSDKGIKLDYFKGAFEILLDYLQDIFGTRLSREVWDKTLSIVYGRLADGYRQLAFLDESQVANIRSNWALILLNKKHHGQEFLLRLFKVYPATQDYFEKFKGKSVTDLRTGATSPALLHHSGQLMDGFDTVIRLLDDNRRLNIFIEWMAKFHNSKGIKEEYVQNGFAVMIACLKSIFGGRLDKGAWDRMFAIVYTRLQYEYKRARGFNASDVASVQDSWQSVMNNKTVHSNAFLIRLFKTRPAAKNYFQKFRDTSIDDLMSLPTFTVHAEKIFDGLNNLLEALENPAKLQGHLQWMAKFHYNMNIQLDFFPDAFAVLVAYLQDVLGNRVNQDSWEKTFAVVYRGLALEYRKVEQQWL